MDFTYHKKEWCKETDRLYEPFLKIRNYEELVQLASNGLNVYHSVTPATRKVIQEASKLAAFTPTPHSTAEDKKMWDKFIDFARKRGFHPVEATEQDVLTWLEQQVQDTSKLSAHTPTPHSTAEDKKVWYNFVDYAKIKGFHPLEATEQDMLTWSEHHAQITTAPVIVQFELRCLQKWRYQARKPLGPISSEAAISKGLLNYLDLYHSGIKSFKPHKLHKLLKRAVLQEKGCNFAALRQISIYVLQFWGFARFVEVQSLKMDHLVRRIDHFDLGISRLKA